MWWLWLAACGSAPDGPGGDTLTVLAASSLAEVLPAAAADWEGAELRFRFDASSRLARQLEAGAEADLLVTADVAWMDWAAARGLVRPETRVVLAENDLVAIVPFSSTWLPSGPAELAAADRIALAGENVPAGRYARAALSPWWSALAPKVVSGDSARTTLAWVAGRDLPVGVVFATDARVEPRVRVAFTFPADAHPPIVYPAALTAGARPGAAELLAHLAAADAAFAAAGFRVGPP